MSNIKEKFILATEWIHRNVYVIAALMAIAWGLFFMLVGVSWLAGFWLNGLYGFHFELASCWTGLLGIVGAAPSLYGLVRQSLGKYRIDSELNSPQGEKPMSGIPNNSGFKDVK